ncbi:MAG TPA: response regulator [Candidatus Saccharimonadales bacterium]|nr:response regulator [Candidatus Saccharimonadales bacterium]
MTKILLVEDDKSLREIYGVRLLAEGYDIVSAGDGEEALAMAIKERPQLIVSDVMMPKISGFDMLDILRSTTETKDIKVIMMTALSSEDQRARGEALGADRYLVKSQVGIEDVVRTVHDVLGDAPTARQTPAQMFNTSRPAAPAATRPAAPAVPPRPMVSTPQPAAPTPQASAAAQAPTPAPAAPQPSTLPQPTAPFSTPRPAGLGERVIHPISQPTSSKDIGSLMEKELNEDSFSAPMQGPAPSSTPSPAPSASSAQTSSSSPFTPQQQPAVSEAPKTSPTPQFTQPTPPTAPFTPSQPATPPVSDPADAPESTLSFEETPRQSGAIPNPFHQGPQPPTQQ